MYCYIRLAWLSRTSIAVTSGRINQNSLGSNILNMLFRTNRNWLSRQDQCQTRKNSRLHILCSRFSIYRSLELGPSSNRGRSLCVATPFRPITVHTLLFKACLSANHFRAQYWPNSKGVCAIYIFRPNPDFQRGEPLGIRGLLRKTRTLFGLELWSKFVFKDFASSRLPGFDYGD